MNSLFLSFAFSPPSYHSSLFSILPPSLFFLLLPLPPPPSPPPSSSVSSSLCLSLEHNFFFFSERFRRLAGWLITSQYGITCPHFSHYNWHWGLKDICLAGDISDTANLDITQEGGGDWDEQPSRQWPAGPVSSLPPHWASCNSVLEGRAAVDSFLRALSLVALKSWGKLTELPRKFQKVFSCLREYELSNNCTSLISPGLH